MIILGQRVGRPQVYALLLLLAFRAEDAGRPARSGALLALAVALKVSPGLLLVDAALRRRWRVLAGAAAGLGAILVLPVPWYGPGGTLALHAAWARAQLVASPGMIVSPGNQSVFALVSRAGWPGWVAVALALAVAAFALTRPAPEPRRSSLLFATALASPLGWIQNGVMALPAAFRVVEGRARWAAVAGGVLLLVPMYDVSGPRFEAWVFERSLPLAAMAALFVVAGVQGPAPAQPAGRGGGAPADPAQ